MPRLSSVPQEQPSALAYIRVSKERDGMISPELQRTAIEDYCARAGYRVLDTIEDLDLSGRSWKRRQIENVIQRTEANQADALVCWKWSRVARNRKDWAIAVDRIEAAGGRLESATEPVDTSTSTGRLARGMLAEFAAFESERIGDTWREAHNRRLRNGLPISGNSRFGYAYGDAFTPDETTGPILAELYRGYLAGESFYSLIRWFNDEGVTTVAGCGRAGGGWTQVSNRRVLDSGFGAVAVNLFETFTQRSGCYESRYRYRRVC